MKVKLTKIARYTTDKNNQPLILKSGKNAGKPYTSVRVQTDQHGERWISGFGDDINAKWTEGQEVEIVVEEKGQYLNFNMPSKVGVLAETVKAQESVLTEIAFKVGLIYNLQQEIAKKVGLGADKPKYEYPEDINPEDIPF